jgi:hypothetical protein
MKKKRAKNFSVAKFELEEQLTLRLEFQDKEAINFKNSSRKNRRERFSRKH